ncbi:cytochrome P450 [Hymenopellis radicata]|nr:cytochrome P450 [Hymenopellis radicata]
MEPLSTATALVLVYLIVLVSTSSIQRPWFAEIPLGPRPLPVIGNLLQIPRHNDNHVQAYTNLGKIYGPIMHMRVFSRHFIMLNSAKAAFDLLEKRSAIYSSRPRLVMAGELVGRDKSLLFLPYGERLRTTRRLIHSFLRADVANRHWPLQEQGVLKLLRRLKESPEKFESHIHSSFVATVMKQVYGYDAQSSDDPYIALAQKLSRITTEAHEPGRWLVDSFPWLRYVPSWMPFAHFKTWAAKARADSIRFTRAPFDLAQSTLDGASSESFVATCLNKTNRTAEEEEIVMYASASLYNGGSDTVYSRHGALVRPDHGYASEIQARAQHEIDAVVGPDRLPCMDDLHSMEYIDCLMKELHRFSPLIPIVPHSPIEDDEYEGFFIPKGSWVMANLWGMLHDPEVYPEPHLFRPERFESSNPAQEPDPIKLAFGLGRRRCPGYHFAAASLFLSITQVLWAFDIRPPCDEKGNLVPPPIEYVAGHSVHPKSFACNVVPRSETKFKLIDEALASPK